MAQAQLSHEDTAELVHNIEPLFSPGELKIEEDRDKNNNLNSVMASLIVSTVEEASEIRQELMQQAVTAVSMTTPQITTDAVVHHP